MSVLSSAFRGKAEVRLTGRQVSYCPRPCENVFPPPKTPQPGAIYVDATAIFLLIESGVRAQPRATLSDLNGHTARTTIHTPHARIAARSGLIPRRFITRVRL